MTKYPVVVLVAATLFGSGEIALAQTQTQSPTSQTQSPTGNERSGAPATAGQSDPRGTGMTGTPSSSNPQSGGGGAGYQTPREVPEAGGAPNTQTPNPNRR
jgi:hypothetical protein